MQQTNRQPRNNNKKKNLKGKKIEKKKKITSQRCFKVGYLNHYGDDDCVCIWLLKLTKFLLLLLLLLLLLYVGIIKHYKLDAA